MDDELQAFALKSAVTEVKNTCPDVSHTFIFTNEGTILASDENTNEETVTHTANAIIALSKRAESLNGLESVTFYSASKRVNVFRTDDYYLGLVNSKESRSINSTEFARMLIPTVLKLTEKIRGSIQQKAPSVEKIVKMEEKIEEKIELPDEITPSQIEETGTDLEAEEITAAENITAIPPENNTEEDQPDSDQLFEPPVTQLMIDTAGRLFGFTDAVRIDNAVVQQWKDAYGEREINEVDVETLSGQTARCKFKPIKDSKHEGTGIIQIPERIRRTLQTGKGELVMVKPVIE